MVTNLATPKVPVAKLPVDREVSVQISRLMKLLRQFAGFRASQPVERKLEKIFSRMPGAEFAQWIKAAESDPQRSDLIALVEDLTNHETYFFREKIHLDALVQNILPGLISEKLKQPGPKKIVLWSAACSSGEEVYTLAMLALEVLAAQGLAREVKPGDYVLAADWSLEVLGTDISRQAIRLAKEAVYAARNDGLSSFRKFPTEYLRFFQPANTQATSEPCDRQYLKVKASLSRYTRFQIFNLVNSTPLLSDIDVIFCRNVFIYIEMDVQKSIVAMLSRALQSRGVLLLGLVDTPETAPYFSKSVLSECVMYRKVLIMSAERLQLVILLIADQLFAIASEYFREVVRSANATPIPFVPAYIEGLVNIDGKIATQIDLGRVVTQRDDASPGTELAFIDTGRSLCALRVQQVVSILDAGGLNIKRFTTPDVAAECVSGEFVHEGHNVLLLNHQAIGRLVQAREVAAGSGGLGGRVRARSDDEVSSINHYLIAYAGGERFGFAIDGITELVKSGRCTPIPGAPKPVSGLTLVRGQPVLTAALQTLLDRHTESATAAEWIVLVEANDLCVGFAVDSIVGIEEYEQAMIINVSHPDSSIRGVVENSSGELTMLVDPANILSGEIAAVLQRYAPSIRQNQIADVAESKACLSVMILDELFAIPLEIVNRVIEYKALESLNGSNNSVVGAIDVDGRVVPVINMHARTQTQHGAWTEYVIVDTGQCEYAIRVNRTDQVIQVPVKNISRCKNTASPFVAAVVQHDAAIYSLFNNEHLNHIHNL